MTGAAGHSRRDLDGEQRRPLVQWEEILATAVGAALAALLLSRLGVAGTIAGAACTPVIIAVTSAAISRQIQLARERAASLSARRSELSWSSVGERLPRGRRLVAALVTAGIAFAIVAVVITVAEAVIGKPVSAWARHQFDNHVHSTVIGLSRPAATYRGVASAVSHAPANPRRHLISATAALLR